MGFREKVALVCLAVITFQTACIFSMPPIWSKKDFSMNRKNNKLQNSESIQYNKRKQPSNLRSFNFPKAEYSPVGLANPVPPETFLEQSSNVKVLDQSEFLNNLRKEKRSKRKYGSLKLSNEKSIQSINDNNRNYLTQIEAFPQMEFPLTASEIWAPNFWNEQSFPLQDPYFDFDKNIYKPQKSQKSIQSNSMQKGKYTTISDTNIKANNKNYLPISKEVDVNILQANDKQCAKLTMHNTTMSKLENNNDKPEEISENISKTSSPKRKPKTRKIKIVTKSSKVLRDIVAKKSNTCSLHNKNSENDCSLKNQSETASHAVSDVINDRKNTEISDLLSDDFDVCFVNQNFGKTTNADSQICLSFDHDKSIEELMPVSDTEQLSKNDSKYLFNSLLNNTIKIKNNYIAAKSDQSSKNVEKIAIIDLPEVEKLEESIIDIKDTVSVFNNTEMKKMFQPLQNVSNKHSTKILSEDDFPIEKLTTTNSDHLANYELLDEETESRDVDTDAVLLNLEHAIVNSKSDGTIDILIPKIKQAILEAIVESASFVPSHITTGFSPSTQNVYYDTNRIINDDVEFVNTDRDHDFDSHDVIRYIKEKYSVPNQTIELNVIYPSNLTETQINPILSAETELDNKTKSPDTLITLPQKNITLNQNEIVKKETLIVDPTSEAVTLKQKENNETLFGLATIIDSLKNITDLLANKRLEKLQMVNVTKPNSNTSITKNEVPANLSSTITSKNIYNYNKMPPVKIIHESINNRSENIIEKNIGLPLNQETDNVHGNNSTINNILDGINRCIISDQNSDTNKEMAKIADITNNYKTLMYDVDTFIDEVDGATLKQDNVTSTSSVSLECNTECTHHNDSQQNYSTEHFDQEEQTTSSLNENDLKEVNKNYIDQSRWKMKYDEENLSKSLLSSDFETRILYADEKQTEHEPDLQLLNVLNMNKNAYIDHKSECENTTGNWQEAPDAETIPNTETSLELLSQEIKSDLSLHNHPSVNDELSSDEFTEEIMNIILDILSMEDSECSNIITNNTVYDNFKPTDYASIEIINEKINTDSKPNLNENKNLFRRTDNEVISNDDSGSMLSALEGKVTDDLAEDTISANFENEDNASDEIMKVKKIEQGSILGEIQEDNESCKQNCKEKELTSNLPKLASYNENVDEIGNTEDTKETYPNISSNNDSSAVAIDAKNIELNDTCTEEVTDNEDITTLNKDDSLLDVSSNENPLGGNNEPENNISESMDSELEDSLSHVKTAENDQNTATNELLPDTDTTEV